MATQSPERPERGSPDGRSPVGAAPPPSVRDAENRLQGARFTNRELSWLEFDRRYLPLGGLLSGFFGGLSGHQGALR